MNLYTIIVTFNGSEWIEQSIKSLVDSNFKTNIIIIDNGSTDGTQNIIKSYSSIKFIESKTNFGFGKANNIGLKIALDNDADYIFLLNQDACVEADTIGNLVEVMESDKKIGIVSPIHLNGSGKALDKLFSTYVAPVLTNDPCLFMSDSYTQQLAEYYEVDFVNAAAWLLSRECIEKVGEFDSLFYHYGEDVNYCQRLKYHDYKLAIVPNSKIFHDRENRIIKKDNSIEFKKRLLLIELSDIRISTTFFKKRISYLKKHYLVEFLIHLVRGRFSKAKESMVYRNFIIENEIEIIQSRKKNKKVAF